MPFEFLTKHPIMLFLDSFDESGLRCNVVEQYLSILGNKKDDKIIITCRSEYLKDFNNEIKWFLPRN